MNVQLNMTKTEKQFIPLLGILGCVGAFLILLSDLTYNLLGGNRFGYLLYLPTYLGIFCFPLWWGGIWVIYQGLKPAGLMWSLVPCVLFGYLVSTVNTAGHASYPYWAAFTQLKNTSNLDVVNATKAVELTTLQYTSPLLSIIQPILEIIICIWIMIPVLRGRTIFPRWIVLLIPLTPSIILMTLNTFYPNIMEIFGPYIGSGFMFVLFIVTTRITKNKICFENKHLTN